MADSPWASHRAAMVVVVRAAVLGAERRELEGEAAAQRAAAHLAAPKQLAKQPRLSEAGEDTTTNNQ